MTSHPINESFPVWSPDTSSVVFSSVRAGVVDLYRVPAGEGAEASLYASNEMKLANDWSGEGRFLLYTQNTSQLVAICG